MIPLIRIRDDWNLAHNEYVISVYGKKKCGENIYAAVAEAVIAKM